MSKGGNQPSGNTTTTQTNQPWSGAVPYITSGLQSAQSLYDAGGPQYYPGTTYAAPNSTQLNALQNLGNSSQTYSPLFNAGFGAVNSADNTAQNVGNSAQTAGNQSSVLFDKALQTGNQSYTDNPSSALYAGMAYGDPRLPGMSTLQSYANGSMLSADNPYFKQMSDTIKAQVLPATQAPFIGANRGVSGLASRAAASGLGDAIGGLAYQNYQQGLGQQQNAASTLAGLTQAGAAGLGGNYSTDLANKYNSLGAASNAAGLGINAGGLNLNAGNLNLNAAQLLPTLQQMGMTADNQSLLAGGQLQGLDQQSINDAVQRWNSQQNLPLQNLQNYISNITAQTGGTGQSSTTQPYFQNQGANALSGALGGGMLGSSLAGTLGLSSGLGTGLGALAGLAFL